MLPSTERYGGLGLTSLSPCFVYEDGHCGPPVEAGASSQAFANLLLGNFGILALRPQVRRVADKVEQMRKRVLAVQDAVDIEKDEPFDSSGPRRLRNVPHEAGKSAAVGDVETLRGVHLVELRRSGCNKERVCFGNKGGLAIA